jgi:2-desacetyl-2-hydroxyethyl bacteriochlorophyllide A dehydrogenase
MQGVILPGQRKVEIREFPVPEPGHGQVLIEMKASSICGSDLRAIYREHLGAGPEAYQNVIAGHEPCGQIVAVGPGCRCFKVGDRVIIYHISGCGVCNDCREGYMISCTSSLRAAYGWQRDGGHADYLLAEESTCVALPESLSYVDGALVSCGFGTAYEALTRVGASGLDRVLIVGMGPVGMAVGLLARAMGAYETIGVDVSEARLNLAKGAGCIDHAIHSKGALEGVLDLTRGHGCEVSVDCSGAGSGRALAIRAARRWGRVVLVGEGPDLDDVDVSHAIIHRQLSIFGSWVTSTKHMEDLVERLAAWKLKPERIVTHKFSLQEAAEAYRIADSGGSGKVCIVMF